jgi:Tol biopolymer transport system component
MLLLILVAQSCAPTTPTAPGTAPSRSGPYLGQPLPGASPEPFAIDVLGGPYDTRDAAWAPSGDRLFSTVWGRGRGTIVTVARDGEAWGTPEIAPFSGTFSDLEAFVSPTGDELFFASKRPLDGGTEEKDWDLWVVRRTGSGWGEPANLGPAINTAGGEYYPSLTADGTLYFTAEREDTLGGEDIYRARRLPDGSWSEPTNLGPSVNSPGQEFNALIAPDETFLIFGSVREGDVGGGDLHIAFRANDGTWLPAQNMGEPVNSSTLDYCPALSPDGRLLFFTSRRVPAGEPIPSGFDQLDVALRGPFNGSSNLWWVDADAIEAMRPR